MKLLTRACLLLLCLLIAPSASGTSAHSRGHAHNDYEHGRPLLDALDQGFQSVEADVWLRDGELLIGHDEVDLQPQRTLQALYLDPLRERAESLSGADPLILLIDIKTDGESTYRALSGVLESYADILASIENGSFIAGPVVAIVSGNRPRATMAAEDPRYAFYDGRLGDLESGLPTGLMRLVSDNWTRHFTWTGAGDMPANEQQKLIGIVTRAHSQGYALRFWGTPDQPGPARDALWRALSDAGVDYINTDDLSGFAAFRTAPADRAKP